VHDRTPRPWFEGIRRVLGRPAEVSVEAMAHETPPEVETVTDELLDAFLRPPTYQAAYAYRSRWPDMRWFALPSFADGHVRVNLAGRERAGIVAKEDYGAVLDEIERDLRSCRDARTGRPIVRDVLRMREADPMDAAGPDADLLVVFDGAPDAIEHPAVGVLGPVPHLRMAHHSPNGFALVSGPGVEPGDLGSRPAYDLVPTILALLGRAPQDGLRGQSLLTP
jgi:predicted AlkP superfamily phosphohydrolase/phosphomutase